MPKIARQITQFSKKEIDELFKRARRVIKHPGFHILLGSKTKEFGRILIIATRKTGNAVQRNKVRRRLKSIFYEEKLFERDHDCIVIVKKEGINVAFEDLKKLLLKAYNG